ncbi:MAG: hypothetical protein ACKVU2_14680 [Saprospiraceae bacterium]
MDRAHLYPCSQPILFINVILSLNYEAPDNCPLFSPADRSWLCSFHHRTGACLALSAQNNPKISVQGTLKAANGTTVADGTYAVTFNLYDVPIGGTVLWFENASVEVLGGIYTHYLCTNKPLVSADFAKPLSLGVKVNNYELVA